MGVSVAFGERRVLREVSIDLGEGELACVMGANGSGKSTLLDVIAGLRIADTGRVDVTARIGFVRQRPAIDRLLTCRENLSFVIGVHGGDASVIDELLARGGLSDRADERAGRLSGGLQRRLDLVRALSVGPGLLLLDEPTAGLDEDSAHAFGQTVVDRVRDLGITAVWVTHSGSEWALGDRRLLLGDGRLEEFDVGTGAGVCLVRVGDDEPRRAGEAEVSRLVERALSRGERVVVEPVAVTGGGTA